MMGEIFYGVDDEDPSYSLKNQYSDLEAYSDLELQFLAEECAADYHRNHDGWEAEFPIEIYIFKKRQTQNVSEYSRLKGNMSQGFLPESW